MAGVYTKLEVAVRLVRWLVTPRKSADRLAKAMLRKAARNLKWQIKHETRAGWSYYGNFSDVWIDASANSNMDRRNEAFELFVPLMRQYVLDTYKVSVYPEVTIAGSPWDSWIGYGWLISLSIPPEKPKRSHFKRLLRRL